MRLCLFTIDAIGEVFVDIVILSQPTKDKVSSRAAAAERLSVINTVCLLLLFILKDPNISQRYNTYTHTHNKSAKYYRNNQKCETVYRLKNILQIVFYYLNNLFKYC